MNIEAIVRSQNAKIPWSVHQDHVSAVWLRQMCFPCWTSMENNKGSYYPCLYTPWPNTTPTSYIRIPTTVPQIYRSGTHIYLVSQNVLSLQSGSALLNQSSYKLQCCTRWNPCPEHAIFWSYRQNRMLIPSTPPSSPRISGGISSDSNLKIDYYLLGADLLSFGKNRCWSIDRGTYALYRSRTDACPRHTSMEENCQHSSQLA